MLSDHNYLLCIVLATVAIAQENVQLITYQTSSMYNSTAHPPYNQSFLEVTSSFNCSLSVLYTYEQTAQQLDSNAQYYVKITNLSQNLKVFPTTTYSIFTPTLNTSECEAGSECIIAIQNNCPNPVGFFNYFDRVNIHIENLKTFTYNVICNSSFRTNTFEGGLLIQIVFCTILLAIISIYSKAWSIGGSGITVTIPIIIGFNVILIIGGTVAAFSLQVVNVAVEVLSWIFGTIGVALCINQIIFLLKFDFLRIGFKLKGTDVRVMQGISLLVGLGACFGWWFSNKNWIVNDIVAVCMTVAGIKIFKFTSLKIAVICFFCTITVQMVFVLIITFAIQLSYNTIILNEFNNPFELQLPTINAVFNQKCAWLPITAIIYPGVLMSYMRRFDSSRNTYIYLITCVVLFLAGSILWMFVSIFSPHSWPFGLIAEPSILGLVSFFAWKRKEIRTLWEGKFYDEQFANKESLNKLSELVQKERRDTRISYEESMFRGLHLTDEESCIEGGARTRKITQQL